MSTNPLAEIGPRMKHLRETKEISLSDAAYQMGCSTTELQDMEEGVLAEGNTWIAKIRKFCDYIGYGMPLLLEGEWTSADKKNLFSSIYDEHVDKAFRVLDKLNSNVTPIECIAVMHIIRERFDQYWQNNSSRNEVIAWRADECFSLDEIDIARILKEIRSGK